MGLPERKDLQEESIRTVFIDGEGDFLRLHYPSLSDEDITLHRTVDNESLEIVGDTPKVKLHEDVHVKGKTTDAGFVDTMSGPVDVEGDIFLLSDYNNVASGEILVVGNCTILVKASASKMCIVMSKSCSDPATIVKYANVKVKINGLYHVGVQFSKSVKGTMYYRYNNYIPTLLKSSEVDVEGF